MTIEKQAADAPERDVRSTTGADQAGTTPSGANTTSSVSDTAAKASEAASDIADKAKASARGAAEARYEEGRDIATGQIDSVGSAVDDLASTLEDQNSPFASYAGELSGQLASLSDKISTSSLDEMADSARRIARDNPAAFLLGSVAIGLAASRFFKATGQEVASSASSVGNPSDSGSASDLGRADVSTSDTRSPSLGGVSGQVPGATA